MNATHLMMALYYYIIIFFTHLCLIAPLCDALISPKSFGLVLVMSTRHQPSSDPTNGFRAGWYL